jgi:23S rRNA (guanosine2251-2'-O)-methyltransferase
MYPWVSLIIPIFFNGSYFLPNFAPMQSKEKIYGIHSILEAISEGVSFAKVFIQKDIHNDAIKEIIQKLKQYEVPFQFVPKEKLNRLTSKNHQGIIAISSAVEFASIDNILPQIFESGEVPFIALLDNVTDVRNFGAIARSAECFGVQALVIPAQGSAMLNADALQASAGALHKVTVCREINFMRSIDTIRNSGLKLVACTEKADKTISEVDFKGPTAIIMGSEGFGISKELLDICDEKAKIPMTGEIQSLNVSVAAGIIFYEAMKQRGE